MTLGLPERTCGVIPKRPEGRGPVPSPYGLRLCSGAVESGVTGATGRFPPERPSLRPRLLPLRHLRRSPLSVDHTDACVFDDATAILPGCVQPRVWLPAPVRSAAKHL